MTYVEISNQTFKKGKIVAKKLVTKDERRLLEEEREPDNKPGARPHFNRYSNVNLKMKTSRH